MEEGERVLPSSSGSVFESFEKVKSVLVAPDWPGSGRMSLVEEKVRMKKLRLAEQVHLALECPKEIVTDTFRGVPKFGFNIYVFDF